MRAAVLALLLFSQGCGVIFQSIYGWSEEHERDATRQHEVKIQGPDNALITRVGPGEASQELGRAPLVDKVTYPVRETMEEPKSFAPLIIGGLLDIGIAAAGVYIVSASSESNDVLTQTFGTSGGVLLAIYGGGAAIADIILSFTLGGAETRVVKHQPAGDGLNLTYVADAGGSQIRSLVRVPWDVEAKFHPGSPVLASAAVPAALVLNQPEHSKRVIAVMNLVDSNAGDAQLACDPRILKNTSDQLRVFIAKTGLLTVDRGSQEKALRDQIQDLKKESYNNCYDESCQIELGKAVAAGFILRSQVTRFGERCVLNSELIDLRTEVSIAAASAIGTCEAEGFLSMAEQISKELAKKAER